MKRKFGIMSECLQGVSTKDALPLIKEAGFEAYFTGCYTSDEVAEFKPVGDALGLSCEFIHAPFRGINAMWMPGMDYLEIYRGMEESIETAAEFGIPTVILHVSSGWNAPQVNDLGLARYDALVLHALDLGVNIAFENLRMVGNLALFADRYAKLSNVGFCYDFGHEHCYTETVRWMNVFREKCIATHIHDNHGRPADPMGDGDEHLLPFEGNVDYAACMRDLNRYGYRHPLILEVDNSRHTEMSHGDFLRDCYERLEKLSEM